jgi:hypothetical protein
MGAAPVNRRPLVGSGQTENVRRYQRRRNPKFAAGQGRDRNPRRAISIAVTAVF